jgi:hypothetical protein
MTATTLVADPFSRRPLVDGVSVRCLSLREALAEKARALLTRRDVAIRDVFDYWHAHRSATAPLRDAEFLDMVSKKISVSTSLYIGLTDERRAQLAAQLATDLRPVLTEEGFRSFPLADALALAEQLAHELEPLLKPSTPV